LFRGRSQLGLQRKLEFKAFRTDNKLEFLAYRGAATELKPRSCYAMKSIVESELEVAAFICEFISINFLWALLKETYSVVMEGRVL
jgi:hypothetical protein